MLLAGLLFFGMAAKMGPAPALPFEDWGACPFEGCAYREWSALKPVVVYDSWKAGRRVSGHLQKGEKVVGVRGVVITFRPGVVIAQRDMPAEGLKRGDRVLTYTYVGEGYALAWYHGRLDAIDVATAETPASGCVATGCPKAEIDAGKKEWWAEVRLKSGRTGWVLMEGMLFDGVDRLG